MTYLAESYFKISKNDMIRRIKAPKVEIVKYNHIGIDDLVDTI